MTAWNFIKELNTICHFMSKERSGKATNSELKRWLLNQAVMINGERVKFDQEVVFPINQFTIFTKNKKITLF